MKSSLAPRTLRLRLFARFALVLSLMAFALKPAPAATILWTGGGDGVSWNNANNWSNNVPPAASDDAVISSVGTNVTITIGSDVTVQSLQCSASLKVSGGNLSLTKGASQVAGNFIAAASRTVTASGTNTSLHASGVTALAGVNLTASGGAVLEFPGMESYEASPCASATWSASGTGSRLVLPGLKWLNNSCDWLYLRAADGGRVEMGAVTNALDSYLNVQADGAGSLVDLSGLVQYQASGSQYATVVAQNGGEVRVTQLVSAPLANFTLGPGTNSVLGLGALTNIAKGSLTVNGPFALSLPGLRGLSAVGLTASGGAVLQFPGMESYEASPCKSAIWSASGAGSRLVLPGLKWLNNSCDWLYLRAADGGRVEMGAVTNALDSYLNVQADGAGSLVDLSGLLRISSSGGQYVRVNALSQGGVVLSKVQSISGGSCSIVSDGTGSVINLTNLSSFATSLAASELTAKNGGVILLQSNAFVLVNVAVNVTGNPVLPPTVSAGAAVSLYGHAWRSYWVEMRDARDPVSAWLLFQRVPLTNDLQVIGGPPESWMAFRVSEFTANPPIVDLHHAEGGQLRLVLYGGPTKSFELQTTNTLPKLPATWSFYATTGTMTNSFRIFPPFTPSNPRLFYRAKEL